MSSTVSDFFERLRARRSVLKRTRKREDLPEAVLYLEWIGGEGARKLLDPEGKEHVLPDAVVESNYKSASKAEGKKLIEKYWKQQAAKKQEPIRKAE